MATKQQEMIYSIIAQNTGAHFLDSGGAYGRHWERNSKRTVEDFVNSPEMYLSAHVYRDGELSLDVTKSLFHHLDNNLEYDEYIDKLFHRFTDIFDRAFYEYWDDEYDNDGNIIGGHGFGDFYWDKAMKCFADLAQKDRKGNRNYNSWEWEGERFGEYTYNHENILSQDFIYDVCGEYVFIQTHNGCDARGGFSWPHVFKLKDDYSLMDYNRYTVSCTNGHWWNFESCGYYEETEQPFKFKDCKIVDADGSYDENLEEYLEGEKVYAINKKSFELSSALPGFDISEPYNPNRGKILVKDNDCYCPVCSEKLEAWSY